MKTVRGSLLSTFTLIVVGVLGIGASMALTRDERWLQWHLSRLGEGGGLAATVFNITLIACAACLAGIATHLYAELTHVQQEHGARTVRLLLYLTAICWVGIGTFPFDRHPIIHNLFGYGEFVTLGVLMLGARRWCKGMTPRTYRLGDFGVVVATLLMVGFHLTHFTSLLIVECVGEVLLCSWLVSLTHDSTRLAAKTR